MKKDEYKFSRVMYIIEAALEYFIAIAVGTVYLARITSYIGISDATTGILTSFVSLGCGFQLLAVFLSNKKPVKKWVTILHLVSQLLFALIYVVPLINLTKLEKTVVFIVLLLVAQILHNLINAPKINWFMSLVDDNKRGKFTANKEIISLVGGIAFSYLLGAVMDYYKDIGQIETSFLICSIGLVILTISHTLTLVLSKEKKDETFEKVPIAKNLKELFKNKTLFKVILISVIWSIANYTTISFTGVYQTKELGFSITFSSVIIMVGSLIRALASRPFGKFADKYSFTKLIIICFSIEAVAFAVNTFTVPSNGKVFFFVYYILYCIGMAGINSSAINLIFDYVDKDQRTNALAIKQTLSGISGFLIVLCVSPIVTLIQNNGNKLFGINLYAQQFLSFISFILVMVGILYIKFVISKIHNKKEKGKEEMIQKTFNENGSQHITELINDAKANNQNVAVVTGNWIIEEAIRIPSNFTVVLDGCHLKQKTGCFSNVFINENNGTELGKTIQGTDTNIKILGKNDAIIDGGEYNGLCEKNANKDGNPPIWKNNLILLTNVDNFELSGFKVQNQRWWAMNLIFCRNGKISDIDVCACDIGVDSNGNIYHGLDIDKYEEALVKNADGIDLRLGCHNIEIENITGFTEDDTIALTALYGSCEKQFFVEGLPTNLCNVTIKRIHASAFCSIVRLLNQGGTVLHDIHIEDVQDTSKNSTHLNRGQYAVRVGDAYRLYGKEQPKENQTYNIVISKVKSRARHAIHLGGKISNLVMSEIEWFDDGQGIEDMRL